MACAPNLAQNRCSCKSFIAADGSALVSNHEFQIHEKQLCNCINNKAKNYQNAEYIWHENDEIKKLSKKAIFEALQLFKKDTLFQNNNIGPKSQKLHNTIERKGCYGICGRVKFHYQLYLCLKITCLQQKVVRKCIFSALS